MPEPAQSAATPTRAGDLKWLLWSLLVLLLANIVVAIIGFWPVSIVTLVGHTKGVNDVLFIGNDTVATASDDGAVRLWSESGDLKKTITGHSDRVSALAFSAATKRFASATGRGRIFFWDVETGIEVRSFDAHSDCISGMTFDSAGHRLFAIGWDATLSVWDSFSGDLLQRVDIPAVAECCVLTHDEQRLLVGCVDGEIRSWDLSTDKVTEFAAGHRDQVKGIRISEDGNTVATCARDGVVRSWSLATGSQLSLVACRIPLRDVLILDNSHQRVVAGTENGQLLLCDLRGQVVETVIEVPMDSVQTLATDGQRSFCAGGYEADAVLFPRDWLTQHE